METTREGSRKKKRRAKRITKEKSHTDPNLCFLGVKREIWVAEVHTTLAIL